MRKRGRFLGKQLWGALLLSLGLLLVLHVAQVEVPLDDEESIRRVLDENVTAEAIEQKIEEALARGDVDEAGMYAELATEHQRPIRTDLVARIAKENEALPTAQRNAMDFGAGFFTGQGNTVAGLAGAVTSDLTVVGDVRDIIKEGSLKLAGEPYDELMLGLATVGLVATGASVATGGIGLPAKLGVSLFKVARKAGTLTAGLGASLLRAVRRTVDYDELGGVVRAASTFDSAAVRDAASVAVRRASSGDLARILGDARHIGEITGSGEAVRLLRYANSAEELSDLATMSTRFGRTTRGVVELTGRTSLRAFKQGVRIGAMILENLIAFVFWFGGIISMMLTRGLYRLMRRKKKRV